MTLISNQLVEHLTQKWGVPSFIANQIKSAFGMMSPYIVGKTDDDIEQFIRHVMQLSMLAMDSEVPIEQFQEQTNETVRFYTKK